MILQGDVSYEQRKQNAERRRQQLEESWNETAKRAKRPVSFSSINKKVSERELISAIHEELTLKQMDRNYLFFLDALEDLEDTDKFEDLFWKKQERFRETYLDNYLHNYYDVLENNPEFEKYKNMNSSQLKEKREEGWKRYNDLCMKMNEHTKKYASLDRILIDTG
jgi:DNA repair exonuclease SbcCD ATPase subunit